MVTLISLGNVNNKLIRRSYRGELNICEVEERIFPNGEVLIKVEDNCLLTPPIMIVSKPYPDVNVNLVKLFQVIDALYGAGLKGEVTVIFTYLPYSRQDRRFRYGEPLSLKVLLDILENMGVSRLVSFDVHNVSAVSKMFKGSFIGISILPVIIEKVLKKLDNGNILLVAPDEGRKPTVKSLSYRYGLDYIVVTKYRDRMTGEVTFNFEDVSFSPGDYGSALIIDDEISTGGTMAGVASFLKSKGVVNLYAVATHLFLVGDAEKRLFKSGLTNIFGTNTVSMDDRYSVLNIESFLPSVIDTIVN